MLRHLDRAAALIVCALGVAHLAVGHSAFIAPNERRIWFASAGFLLIVTGLANLAASRAPTRMQSAAAASGALSILIVGALLARAEAGLLTEPQTLVLLASGAMLTAFRAREIFGREAVSPATARSA